MTIKDEKKANCHIHITGSLNPQDLRKIASKSGININNFEPLESKMTFYNPDIWVVAKEVTSTKVGLEEAIRIILERESKDKVTYLELTINPAGMIRRGLRVSELISVLRVSSEYACGLGMVFKVKLGVNRKDGKESIQEIKKIFDQCPKSIVVAIDLNGDERYFPTGEFENGFLALRDEGIPTTVHAGELLGLEKSLLSAVRMKPTRIAHSLVAKNDNNILERIKKEGIVLEVSPLSGMYTKAIPNIKEYPFRKFLDYEIPLVFGSDDPAIFNKNLSDHLLALQDCGLKIEGIVKLIRKSFDYLL